MSIFVAPEEWMMELADSANTMPGITAGPSVWELPAALDIDLLHEKDSFKVWGGAGEIYRVTITDPRASIERDTSMSSGMTEDGRTWYYADINIVIGMTDKIFIMRDPSVTDSFIIELCGGMDTPERRAALIALGFREL